MGALMSLRTENPQSIGIHWKKQRATLEIVGEIGREYSLSNRGDSTVV